MTGFIHSVSSARLEVVRRCSRHLRTVRLLSLSASLLIAGRKAVNMLLPFLVGARLGPAIDAAPVQCLAGRLGDLCAGGQAGRQGADGVQLGGGEPSPAVAHGSGGDRRLDHGGRVCGSAWGLAIAGGLACGWDRVGVPPGREVGVAGRPGEEPGQRLALGGCAAGLGAGIEIGAQVGQRVEPGAPGGGGDGPDPAGQLLTATLCEEDRVSVG